MHFICMQMSLLTSERSTKTGKAQHCTSKCNKLLHFEILCIYLLYFCVRQLCGRSRRELDINLEIVGQLVDQQPNLVPRSADNLSVCVVALTTVSNNNICESNLKFMRYFIFFNIFPTHTQPRTFCVLKLCET